MGLNIKNDEVHRLARLAAARTGQNQTSVIETALRSLLDDLDRRERARQPDDLIREMQEAFAGVDLSTDDLYDAATGLPR